MSCIDICTYCRLTGAPHPGDGEEWQEITEALRHAEAIIDAATLYGYVGDIVVPPYIAYKYEEAVAFQALYIMQVGGVGDFNNLDMGSVSLGKFSYGRGGTGRSSGSGGTSLPISPIASANIPLLRAYVRTIRKGVIPDASDTPQYVDSPGSAQTSGGD